MQTGIGVVLVIDVIEVAVVAVTVAVTVRVAVAGVEGCCALVDEEVEEGFCKELLAPLVEAPFDATVVNNEFELPGLVLKAEVLPTRDKLFPPNPSAPI